MFAIGQVYPSVLEVSDRFPGLLLDAYGVFWGGNDVGLLPRSKETMEYLVQQGKKIGILSNSTQLGTSEIEKLAKRGLVLGTHFHFLVTSGDVAKQIFREEELPFETPRKKFWLFGGVHPRYSPPHALFQGSRYEETPDLEEADFIYISIPHLDGADQTDPQAFQDLIQRIAHRKLPMVCANPDRFAYEGSPPRAVVRQGSIAALYEQLGGSVFYVGKPSTLCYKVAMHHFESLGLKEKSKILMVGDTPETDIKGARNFGMASALVTETGIMKGRLLCHPAPQLSALETPDYYIQKLASDDFI